MWQNRQRNKFIVLFMAFCILFGVEKLVKNWEWARIVYTESIYYPLQSIRNYLFRDVIFSVGDALYVLLVIASLVGIFRLLLSLGSAKYRTKGSFAEEFFRVLRWAFCIYAFFVMSWGMNYTRKPLLYDYYKNDIVYDSTLGRKRLNITYEVDSLIARLDQTQERLIQLAPFWQDTTKFEVNEVNAAAFNYFRHLIEPNTIATPLKRSSLGVYLQQVGIQGYFVPFTGEVHYSGDMFYIYRPFVYLHEMAHQKGIASELDANFLAYVLSISTKDPLFEASATFELFTYLASDLRRIDSIAYKDYYSNNLKSPIRDLLAASKKHREKYRTSFIRPYTMGMYDGFLKFFGQNDGLKSYSMMTYKVMLYQNRNLNLKNVLGKFE